MTQQARFLQPRIKLNYKQKQQRRYSNMILLLCIIFGVILAGDVIGATIFLRQSPQTHAYLATYVENGISNSFFEIFWTQFLYKFTIFAMGATIIGNVVNLFLVFTRGVTAGFNLAFLISEASFWAMLLWVMQYIMIIFTTILSVYFSLRFAYVVLKSLVLKRHDLIKKHTKLYIVQFVVIMIFTIITSFLTMIVSPIVINSIS